MKFTSLSLLFAGLAPSLSSAQTLEEKWNLEDPTFIYDGDNKEFELTYLISDMLPLSDANIADQTLATIYLATSPNDLAADDNCKMESKDNTYINGQLSLSYTGVIANPAADPSYETKKQETVIVALNTDGIQTDDSIFKEGDQGESATIAFCVRYGLYTGTPNAEGSYEVNFLESLVIFSVDLTAGFTVDGVSVAPKDKLKRTASQEYELEAFQCEGKIDEEEPALEYDQTVAFNQGDVITICVQPDETARGDNIYMKRIEEFTYTLLNEAEPPVATSTTQKAIQVGGAGATDKGEMYGLTNIDNCEGSTACMIETILFATFYTRPGTVSGAGRGTMQFGTNGRTPASRMLRSGDRALEEATAAEGQFDVNFALNSNDAFEGASGASSCMTVLALFGSVAAALAF